MQSGNGRHILLKLWAYQAGDVSLRYNVSAVVEACALPVGFAAAALKILAPQIAEGLADVALQPFRQGDTLCWNVVARPIVLDGIGVVVAG